MKKKKERKIKGFKRFLLIIGIIIGSIFLLLVEQNIPVLILRNYIKSFDKIEYTNQIIPEVKYKDKNNGNGYYTFTVTEDRELKIMNLTDIHIGGGLMSLEKDKKTVYEVMTMISIEKPDLVILDGDNTFCVPSLIFNGGGTFNNKMTTRSVNLIFETLGVYYTTVFGNHDTEAFDYYSREYIGKLYSGEIKTSDSFEHCIFRSEFTDKEKYDRYSVSNQVILVENKDNEIVKAITLLDSNDYVDGSLSSSINWKYDTIHEEQVVWAKERINEIRTLADNVNLKSLFFFHIPISEFYMAYNNYINNDLENTEYISGIWDEEIVTNESRGVTNARIWYGGISNSDNVSEKDRLFETLGPNGLNAIEAIFCGHDHTNWAVVKYYGVTLSYGYSLDNLAYSDLCNYGLQRGSTVITVSQSGIFSETHKNCYIDYGCSTNEFYEVNVVDYYYYNDEREKIGGLD